MKRQKNSLFLTLIILATVFVVAVFGTNIWKTYQEEKSKEESLLSELKDITAKLEESQATQAKVESMTDSDELARYYDTTAKSAEEWKPKDKFREDIILKYLYDTVDTMKDVIKTDLSDRQKLAQDAQWREHDFIENITFSPGVRNEYGFKEGRANISFVFTDEKELIEYIRLLVESKDYEIFIHELSYPEFGFENVGIRRVNIPLKFWYQ